VLGCADTEPLCICARETTGKWAQRSILMYGSGETLMPQSEQKEQTELSASAEILPTSVLNPLPWTVAQPRRSQKQAHEQRDHPSRQHGEADHSSVRLEDRPQLRPTEFRGGCSSSAADDLRQI
jgi:hypothetical protein